MAFFPFKIRRVNALPEVPESRTLYLIRQNSGLKIVLTGSSAEIRATTMSPDEVGSSIEATRRTLTRLSPRNVPDNTTCLASDAGGMLRHPSSDATARTWNIPEKSVESFDDGAVLTFMAMAGSGPITITCGDTLRLLPTGTTGSRTLTAPGQAVAIKNVLSNGSVEWTISGTNLT